MELGMIGMGRMGNKMAQRLMGGGHRILAYDPAPAAVAAAVQQGAVGVSSIAELAAKLTPPRSVWLMVPSGEPTETTISRLAAELSPGDTIIDGGNSDYKDTMRRAKTLAEKGLVFLDVGTSGGIWGLKEGYSLMVGGDRAAYRRMEPVFQTLAPSPSQGYGYVGISGAGHFVKLVHNGIEYGLMQAYAEGFELMQAKPEFKLDLPGIAGIWRYGSVIRSWLLDLAAAALQADPELDGVEPFVEDSGEGRWFVRESLELGVSVPVISQSLQIRFRSREQRCFGDRLLAALRNQFGGHAVRKTGGGSL